MAAWRPNKIIDLIHRRNYGILDNSFLLEVIKGFIWIRPTGFPKGLDVRYERTRWCKDYSVLPSVPYCPDFLSLLQPVSTLVPPTIHSSHSSRMIFSRHKLVSELLFTVGKRWNSHPCSHNCIPSYLSGFILCLVLQLLFWTLTMLAFVPHLIMIPFTERTVLLSFFCLQCLFLSSPLN